MKKHKQIFSHFTRVGRQDFVSPEIEAGSSYDFRVDTYGLGLTILCLISYEYPINLLRDQITNKVIRNIDFNKIHNNYNIYLKQLVLRMTNNDINLRPFANEALEQLTYIEGFIKNPENPFYKEYLDKKNELFLKNFQQPKKKFNINFNIKFNQNNNNQNNPNNLYQNNYNNNQNNNNQNNYNNVQNNYNNNQNNFNNNQKIFNNNNQNFVNNQNYFSSQNKINLQQGNQNNVNFKQGNQNSQFNLYYQNQVGNFRPNINKNSPIIQNVNLQPVPIYQYNQCYLFEPNYNFFNLLQKMQMKPLDLSQSSDNIYLIQNNTPLIRVLQCLYEIFKDQNSFEQTKFIIKEMKNYKQELYFSLNIINILEIIGKNNSGEINVDEFTDIIQNFRGMLIERIKRFNDNSNQMIPKWIFYEIFSNFNKDIIDFDIPWQNNILDDFIGPNYLSRNSFPNLYENIEQFKTNYKSFFVDNFYFIILRLTSCPYCMTIINVDPCVSSLLNLDSNLIDNVSNLIKKELFSEDSYYNNNNYYCQICKTNVLGKSRKTFLNTPPFY